MASSEALVEAVGLTKRFPPGGWLRPRERPPAAVWDVDLSVAAGETLGLVGESGCGKSTLARLLLRLIEPTAGHTCFNGQDLRQVSRRQLQRLREKMQIIFQDPSSALNPRMTVGRIIAEPLVIHGLGNRRERGARVAQLLERVGLGPEHAERYPGQLSGGQQQRVGIARALVCSPRFIVADEPLSALDSSTQVRIINLLMRLQQEEGLSYLFITHDIGTVRYISDRVAVMYQGRIVELGSTERVLGAPRHPYTELLLSCVLPLEPHAPRRRVVRPRERVIVGSAMLGCPFALRCPEATADCREAVPNLREASSGHYVRCTRR